MTTRAERSLAADPSKANARVIFALWLVHFTGDLYASFVSPLLRSSRMSLRSP